MNERIRELAEQAGLEFDDDEALEFGKQIYYVTKEDMEKFAELIVRECARVADDSNQLKNRPVGVSVGDVVLKNFGVEE